MINEYLYEIIVLIVILTSLVIFFLTRKGNQKEIDVSQNTPHEEIKPLNEPVPSFEPEDTDNEKKESFEKIEASPVEDFPTSKRKKCEVPEHGKITKDSFEDFKGAKILVAEDNLINQKVILGLLNGSGIDITIADDGQIALDILEKNSDFDLILMDAHMPNIDGFEATRAIRNNPRYENIVVVALSGDTGADDIRKMEKVGMQEHLEKPLRMEALYNILYAYTMQESPNEDTYTDVVKTKELNGDKGLAVCGGDEIFYKDILNEFINTYTNTSRRLLALIDQGELNHADALLLDFIGITANIGADNIREIALKLKGLLSHSEDKKYITTLNDFDIHLEILIQDVKDYLT